VAESSWNIPPAWSVGGALEVIDKYLEFQLASAHIYLASLFALDLPTTESAINPKQAT